MKQVSRYNYEKRIKRLESENRRLEQEVHEYRGACSEIYDGLVTCVKDNANVSKSFLLTKLKAAWRPRHPA